MSELTEKVKRLIQRAKDTGDMELLELATDMLDTEQEKLTETSTKTDGKFEEFAMSQNNDKFPKPVDTKKPRPNLYQDKGEHKDSIHKTPSVELTERRRPSFKKVNQTCQRCSKVVKVSPSFARDFFTCDSCLRR